MGKQTHEIWIWYIVLSEFSVISLPKKEKNVFKVLRTTYACKFHTNWHFKNTNTDESENLRQIGFTNDLHKNSWMRPNGFRSWLILIFICIKLNMPSINISEVHKNCNTLAPKQTSKIRKESMGGLWVRLTTWHRTHQKEQNLIWTLLMSMCF